jgi:hypothetical protein
MSPGRWPACCACAPRGLANSAAFGLAALAALSGVVASVTGLLTGAGRRHQSVQILPALIPMSGFPSGSIRWACSSFRFALFAGLCARILRAQERRRARRVLQRCCCWRRRWCSLADNAFFFLIAWEIMALTAYCLVSFEHEKEETRNAGVLYFVMSHIGTGCLILGFLLLFQAARAGDYSFRQLSARWGEDGPGPRDAAFLLFLFGFGVKAGIVPLHIWLPAAHPVAPSNVSASCPAC